MNSNRAQSVTLADIPEDQRREGMWVFPPDFQNPTFIVELWGNKAVVLVFHNLRPVTCEEYSLNELRIPKVRIEDMDLQPKVLYHDFN